MEKRRVTITVGGQPYSFASDDPDEYIRTLEKRTNAALKETAEFAPSAYAGAILAVISQTDRLLRAEEAGGTEKAEKQGKPQKAEPSEGQPRKETARKKASAQEKGQVSMWELLEKTETMPETAAEAEAPAGQTERMPEMPTKVGSPVDKSNTAAIDGKIRDKRKAQERISYDDIQPDSADRVPFLGRISADQGRHQPDHQ